MKKLMTLMLGLSLFVGATVTFAQDDTTKTKKMKKMKKMKKTHTDTTMTSK